MLAEFNKALARDHARLTVNGFTALGLVEMTRKRTRESLAHVLCEVCLTCQGRGEVKTARTVCYEILRANCCAKRASSTRASSASSRGVGDRHFLDEESRGWRCSPDFIGKPIACLRPSRATRRSSNDIVPAGGVSSAPRRFYWRKRLIWRGL